MTLPISTSIHSINADNKLSLFKYPIWFFLNMLNNSFPNSNIDSHLIMQDYIPNSANKGWINTRSSPPRMISDLFWKELPWESIEDELGQINILDTGCGSGNYGVKLSQYSRGTVDSYTGIDNSPNDNWKILADQYTNFKFYCLNSSEILSMIPNDTNMFISQSAIEHLDEELTFFRIISEYIQSSGKNIIQVHLFPSSICLKLYFTHGVRQYTPRTISKITRIFTPDSYAILYGLGGKAFNQLHYSYITKPYLMYIIGLNKIRDLRNIKTEEYNKRLREIILLNKNKVISQPSFYALIIHSNYNKLIF